MKIETGLLVVCILVCALFAAVIFMYLNASRNNVGDMLQRVSSSVNKKAPFAVSNDVRFDKSVVLPGNTIEYYFTLHNFTTEYLKNIDSFKEKAKQDIKADPKMAIFRKNKVDFVYIYNDKDKKEVARIKIGYDDYK
ncbi:MAG: hypothetical protein LBU55_04140 [Elusimicrobiota bacterium]|jgi:hypothetical protein|nr:hypothetical protein [Elusimicrobiota bacterium]